jgi:hypothetical protein
MSTPPTSHSHLQDSYASIPLTATPVLQHFYLESAFSLTILLSFIVFCSILIQNKDGSLEQVNKWLGDPTWNGVGDYYNTWDSVPPVQQ